jgi:hypothetical protein
MASRSRVEKVLTLKLSSYLNRTARIFGFPTSEFLLLLAIVISAGKALTILLPVGIGMIIILGRVRAKKPVSWFQFLPYLWFKIRYAYLLPPGKKTFLP